MSDDIQDKEGEKGASPVKPFPSFSGPSRTNLPFKPGSSGLPGSPAGSSPIKPPESRSESSAAFPGLGGASKPAPADSGEKKDDKPRSGSSPLGGLGGLSKGLPFGGGEKKDAKKDDKPAATKKEGSSSPLGGLGGLSKGLPFGGGEKKDAKKDDKPAKPRSAGGGGGPLGALGGLSKNLPFGGGEKKDAKKDNKPAASAVSPKPSAFAPPSSSSSSAAAPPKQSPFGAKFSSGGKGDEKATGDKPATPKKADKKPAGVNLKDRIANFKLFKAPESKKARASKAVKVESEGLSLDTKLDILGVVLMLGSLGLIFSSLSPNQGELTGGVNAFLSQNFGWGALAIPFAMGAVGIWLILRHFGDEAPKLDTTRVIGIAMLYVGALVLFQYVDSFSYELVPGETYLNQLRDVWLPISWMAGRGGGYIGAEIYYFLLANFTEMGGFFLLLAWLVIGIMLTLSLSAAEMAIIVISVYRSFSDAQRRRARRRAALAAEKRALVPVAAGAAPELTVEKPQPQALPPAQAPALPAAAAQAASAELPTPEAAPIEVRERSIPIMQGGRTVTASIREGEPVTIGAAPLEAPPIPAPPLPQPVPVEKPAAARSGFGRMLGGLPLPVSGSKPADKPASIPAEKPAVPAAKPDLKQPAAEKPGGLLGGRLFGGKPADKPAAPAIPAPGAPPVPSSAPAAASAPGASAQQPSRLGGLLNRSPQARPAETNTPAAALSADSIKVDAVPATPTAESAPPAPSVPAASIGAPPDAPVHSAAPAASTPGTEGTAEQDLSNLPPATPKGTLRHPELPSMRPPGGLPARPLAVPPPPSGERELLQDRLAKLRAYEPPERKPPSSMSESAAEPAPPAPEAKPAEFAPEPAAEKPVAPPTFTPDKPAAEAPAAPAAAAFFATAAARAMPRIVAMEEDEASKPPTPAAPAAEIPSLTQKRDLGIKPPPPSLGTTAANAAPAKPAAQQLPWQPTQRPEAPQPPTAPPAVPPAPPTLQPRVRKQWRLPDFAKLLVTGSEQELDHSVLIERARIIEDTLSSFGAPGKVVEVRTGPVVTQFGVEPDYLEARGGKKIRVKVSAIAQLDKDLQLALGAKSIRIEAPVPGKGYVGIEVPNEEAAVVRLRDVLEANEFKRFVDKPLAITLGQSVDGTPIAADLASMPHLLIAGTTGSGKSVCVNAIISGLLLRNTPDRLKFIMVDPKRVELTSYNGVPHLVAPVVVELERIVSVLKWVTREMDERYKKFSSVGARNIEDFNKHLPQGEEIMPYIIVIIDELADLMMLAPDETERVITRIAALARATGIHLVIATQRPSVDVVTGLIKANFPARIAFAVAGSVDSRVILDQPGAERLLGRGDMLYMSGDSPAPQRLQGVYVSDSEITNITRYWRSQTSPEDLVSPALSSFRLTDEPRQEASAPWGNPRGNDNRLSQPPQQKAFWDEELSGSASNGGSRGIGRADDDDLDDDEGVSVDGEDAMYDEAVELVRRLNKASVSLLQRRLRIGYTRAARLIDLMEERGVVGPPTEGSKPREVL